MLFLTMLPCDIYWPFQETLFTNKVLISYLMIRSVVGDRFHLCEGSSIIMQSEAGAIFYDREFPEKEVVKNLKAPNPKHKFPWRKCAKDAYF